MKRIIFIFCIGVFFYNFVKGEDVKVVLTSRDKEVQHVLPGDVFNALIQIIPYEQEDIAIFNKLKGNFFLNNFFIVDIKKISRSINNYDVLEIDALIALKDSIDTRFDLIWSFQGEDYSVVTKNISFGSFDEMPSDYYIYFQKGKLLIKEIVVSVFITLILLVVLISWRLKKYYRKKINKRRDQYFKSKKESLLLDFNNAETRKDFEAIYSKKDELVKYFLTKEESKHIKKYCELISEKEYKGKWNKMDVDELKRITSRFQGEL